VPRPATSFDRHGTRTTAALFEGNRDALKGFTDDNAVRLVALLTRLIANLDRAANAGEPSHSS